MSSKISLKELERKAFRIKYNDGMWDIFLGCFFLTFVIGPYLSPFLGDFWSSVIFLPFWGLVFLGILLVRKLVITPRVGRVKFGVTRMTRLKRFTVVMLSVNIITFVLGLWAALNVGRISGQLIGILFGMQLLMGFSMAAYFLDFNRLYVYGLLVGLSPPVGEWLWARGYASHHGFPITFGTSSGIMILAGLIIFIRLLRNTAVPTGGTPPRAA